MSGLFHTWSLYFARPFPITSAGIMYILVGLEHPSSWLAASDFPSALSSDVVRFADYTIRFPVGPPEEVLSDNGAQFTAGSTQKFAEKRN